jgi:SAM-dependent methyltransferase
VKPKALSRFLAQEQVTRILEVGGGSTSSIHVPGAQYTVIDCDAAALDRNDYATEKLLGDAQAYDYGSRVFDAVVIWNVLEHMAKPEAAVTCAIKHLRAGGYMIIAGPVLNSVKALITRMTPYRMHVWFYRHVLNRPDAGTPGNAPYAVEHSSGADVERLQDQLREQGFEILSTTIYEGIQTKKLRKNRPLLYKAYDLFRRTAVLATRGAIKAEGDFILLCQKRADQRRLAGQDG